jgi:hypothetical protein
MPPPTIDATNPDALLRELFDDDRWVKDQFAAHLSEPLRGLCEALAACFRLMGPLNDAANRVNTQRTALVAAFVFGVLDDLVVSTKLLLTGKLPASGNLMRQVVEGIAMSFLCSTDELLIIETKTKNRPPVMARYWEKVWGEDERAQGYRAVGQLGLNAVKLGVAAGAVEQLRRAKKYYNGFSHCGTTTITNRVPLEEVGVFHLSGLFDEAKLDFYIAELDSRISLCRVLPPFMEHLIATMTPPAARPAAPAQQAKQA